VDADGGRWAGSAVYVVQQSSLADKAIVNDLGEGFNLANIEKAEVRKEDPEGLPALFGKMAEDLTELFDAKLALLKIEVREDVEAYVRGTAMIAVGAVVALVGFALLNVAVAFLVSTLFQNTGLSQPVRYAFGFAITAVVYLIGGGILIMINKNRMAAQKFGPERTITELKRDKEAIEEEI
jgi:uncharacterized membrane protein YqjE